MKLSRKNVGRIATTFLATAMLASLTAVPAMAVDTEGNQDDQTTATYQNDTFSLTKTLTKPEGVYTPAASFKFTIKETVPRHEVRDGMAVESGDIRAFDKSKTENDTYVETSIDFAATDGQLNDQVVTKSVETPFSLNADCFDHAGVYRYVVEEVEGDYEGVYYDVTEKPLYLYVGYEDGSQELSVLYAVMVNGLNEDGTENKTSEIVNDYGTNDVEDEIGSLSIVKEVSGNQGNRSEPFEFTIKIDGASGEKYRATIYTYDENEGKWVEETDKAFDIVSGDPNAKTFTLTNAQKIVISGLSATDRYTIVETAANTNNYKTLVEGDEEGIDTVENENTKNEPVTITGTIATANTEDGNTVEAGKIITYQNIRNISTPTGIVMNVAPYALLVVIAAAGCFVFLRKRDED